MITSVTASSYGSSITYLPEHQPSAALDGNTQTSWLTNSFAGPRRPVVAGQRSRLRSPRTRSALVQPQTGDPDRSITSATLTFDGGNPVKVDLGPASAHRPVSWSRSPPRSFSTLRITIDTVAVADPSVPLDSRSSVGFAEVGIPGITVDETIAMPDDLLRDGRVLLAVRPVEPGHDPSP